MAFGQELKDFLGAMAAGQQVVTSMGDREYKRLRNEVLKAQAAEASDPEMLGLKKDRIRAQTDRALRGPAMHPAQQERLKAQTDYWKLQQEMLKRQGIPSVPLPDTLFDTQPDAPQAPKFDTPEQPRVPNDQVSGIPRYADGGLVEDDEDFSDGGYEDDYTGDEFDDGFDNEVGGFGGEERMGAIPSSPTAPMPQPRPQAQASDQQRSYNVQAAHDAVLDGMKYAMKATGATQTGALELSAQRRSAGNRAYLSGVGAADPDTMNTIRNALDPDKRLSEDGRNLAAFSHVYGHYMKQGNLEGAQRAAATMVQFFRSVSNRYQALAQAAAEKGDVNGTVKAVMKAYANIPNGQEVQIQQRPDGSLAYSLTDSASGKTIENGIATPEQLLEFVTKGGMRSFDDIIAAASGQRVAGAGGGRGKKDATPKLEDRKAGMDAINEFVSNSKGTKLTPATEEATKYAASQIHRVNDLDEKGAEALRIANAYGHGEKGYVLSHDRTSMLTPDGRKIKLPEGAFDNLVALRVANRRAKEKAEEEAKRERDRNEERVGLVEVMNPKGTGVRGLLGKPTRAETYRKHFAETRKNSPTRALEIEGEEETKYAELKPRI